MSGGTLPCAHCDGTGRVPDWRELGRLVRGARLKRGLRLREAARQLKVSPAYLSDLERGARAWWGPKAQAYSKMIGIHVQRGTEPRD